MTSLPNALLALADVASVYEECASYAASMASTPASAAAPCLMSRLSHDSTSVRATPASSRPAKKRPVPVEFTHPDPDLPQAAAEGSMNPSSLPKNGCDLPSEASPLDKAPTETHSAAKSKKKPKLGRRNRRIANVNSTPSFPAILMGILSTPQNSEFITFLKDRCRFVVLDKAKFEAQVLPVHFGATPATSSYWNFTKMLDEWGFVSEKDDEFPGLDVYGHPKFRQGDWEECLKINKPASFNPTMVDFKRTSPLSAPYGVVVDGLVARPPLMLPCDQANAHAIASPPSLPQISHLEPPNASSIAFLNASLSKHMSATESSRILCNRLGLFQNSNALKAIMQAQQARSRVIAEAMETFHENGRPRTISPEFSQMARHAPPSRLDALTEQFIKQSVERMQSRQVLMSQFNGLGMPSI